MTKKKLISIIVVAVLAVAVLGVSVTWAVVTADNRSQGSLTTAGLSVSATVKNMQVYSAVAAPSSAAEEDIFYDENNKAYIYEKSNVEVDGGKEIKFSVHDGSVRYDEKSVTVSKIMPGDKIEFDIAVTSTSTISFDYRAELYVDASRGQELLNQLDFTAGDLGIVRKDVGDGTDAKEGEMKAAVLTDYAEWAVAANQANVETVHVTMALPITADGGQDQSVYFEYVAKGVQSTEVEEDIVVFEDGTDFKKLAEAVKYAEAHNITEIPVVGSTVSVGEEGQISVNRALHFVGKANQDGNYPVLRGARFVVGGGTAVTFDSIAFAGESYIDVSNAVGLTMNNCKTDVTPVEYFDTRARSFLKETAFIVSSSTLTPVELNLTNNSFVAGVNAQITDKTRSVVSLRSPLFSGTKVSDCVFGTAEKPYDGTAIVLGGSEGDEPTLTVQSNDFYAQRVLYLGGQANSTAYLAISKNNKAYGVTDFASGTAAAAIVDNGSTIDGEAIVCADIDSEKMLFGGVNVTLNPINRIELGDVAVSENITMGAFFTRYTVGSALAQNAVTLYRNGQAYAYLNADGSVSEI